MTWNRTPINVLIDERVATPDAAPTERWPTHECRSLTCYGFCYYDVSGRPHTMQHRPDGDLWRCRRCGVLRPGPSKGEWWSPWPRPRAHALAGYRPSQPEIKRVICEFYRELDRHDPGCLYEGWVQRVLYWAGIDERRPTRPDTD